MKSPSLESFYHKIDKKISLAQAYTEIEGLSYIIKSCRLKPSSYVFQDRENKITLHEWWFDEFGNSLQIKDKKINIIYNDLSLEREKIVCTDLYSNLDISKIVKVSKVAYVAAGKDDDFYRDIYLLGLLGLDDYWRCYLHLYGEWAQVSPLLIGLETLGIITKKIELKYFTELDNNKNIPIPCVSGHQWLTSLPLSDELLNILKKEHEQLLSFLYKKDN